jgi:hypothetical protein
MQTRVARRVFTAAVASGLLFVSACSSNGAKAPAAVIKASEIDAAIKQYVVTHNDQPVQKICEKLYPSAPTDIVGTDSPYGADVTTDVESMSTSLSLACKFLGTDCDVSLSISTTSSGSVDPEGLTPKDGHYLDYADGNGVQVEEEVGSDTSSANGCTISIGTGKTSIQYLNDVIARVSDN